MATYNVDLGNITVASGAFVDGTTKAKIGTVTGVYSDTNHTITFAGFGKLTYDGTTVSFIADAAAPTGTYTFTDSVAGTNPAKLTVVNAAAMTGALTLGNSSSVLATLITGAGNDNISAQIGTAGITATTKINTGAGNDTVALTATTDTADVDISANPVELGAGNDSVTFVGTDAAHSLKAVAYGGDGNDTLTAGANSNVTLRGGAGADTFEQQTGGKMDVADYDYSQGDVIKAAATANFGVDADGKITVTGAGVTGQAVSDSSIFKVKAIDTTTPKTTEYWTAATASGTVAMDLSKVTSAYVVDAKSASAANVTVGSNAGQGGSVSLNSASANSLTVSKAGGLVAVNGFNGDDVLNLAGTLDVNGMNIVSQGTSVSGVLSTGSDVVSYTENGNAAAKKKAGILSGSSKTTITLATTTLDKYINKSTAAGSGVINASALTGAQTFRLNNDDGKNAYAGIYEVVGGVDGGVYVGTANVASTTSKFNLAAATVGSQVWAGGALGTAVDVTLNAANAAQDMIWFGKTDAQTNVDQADEFGTGFAATDDVVYLYDVANVNQAGLYKSAAGGAAGNVEVAAATTAGAKTTAINRTLAAGQGTQLKVKDATGKMNYVAVGTNGAGATIDADDGAQRATYVVGTLAASLNTVQYNNSTLTGQNYTVRLKNDLANADVAYAAVDNADLSGVAADATMVLVGANDTVAGSKLQAGGASAEIWGGGAMADHIAFSTVAGASNRVWYGKTDGKDEVTNMTAAVTAGQTDTVYLYDAASLKDAMKTYNITNTTGSLVLKADDDHTLTLTGDATNFSIQTQAGTAKVQRVASDAALDYDADTNVYIGGIATKANTVKINASGTTGATIRLNNDGLSNSYYAGITTANASGVTAGNVVLVGDGTTNNAQLTGGFGAENDYWGGGKVAEEFIGQTSIKDVAWFDAGDGADKATNFGKEDEVKLYNTSSIDQVKVGTGANTGSLYITASDGDQLEIAGGITAQIYGSDGITIALGNGSNYYVSKDATTNTYSLQKKA